jgi:two-component system, response regulator YesN
MYKLLIVDDEPIIRQGLRTIIDWSAFDVRICGEADNGIDGLRLCKEMQPDVVIIDIKMPGLDGLELIAEARRCGADCDFIVLSGFSEFAYAQRATEYGVRSYMLKPIEQKELAAKIAELRAEWEYNREEQARRVLAQRMQLEQELQRIFQTGLYPEPGSTGHALLVSQLRLPWTAYRVMLIGDDRRPLEVHEWSGLRDALEAIGLRGSSGSCGVAFSCGSYVAAVTDAAVPADRLSACLSAIESGYNLRLVVALGNEVSRAERLSESYQTASMAMRDRFFYERCERMLIRDIREQTRLAQQTVNDGMQPFNPEIGIVEAAQAVATGHAEVIHDLQMAAMEAMLQADWEEHRIRATFITFYSGVLGSLAAIDMQVSTFSKPLHDIVKGVGAAGSLLEVCSYIESELLHCMEEWAKNRKHESFIAMLGYIAEHYDSDLKLETLAEIFHYNKSYLGKLFKAQTGENFGSYLDRIRIDKAKLLLAGGAKVYEVAGRVGYASVDYFHLKFKKYVGESPSAYRDKWTS